MKKAPTSFEPERRPTQAPARKWVLILISVIGLGIVVLLMVASQRERSKSKGAVAVAAADEPVPESSAARNVATDSTGRNPAFVRVPSGSGAEPQVDARELVKRLSEINPQSGALTPEKAAQWQRDILELIGQGTAAVPPLQEFFQKNQDVRFDSSPGANLLGEPSLRIAFLKVLSDLPAPENVELEEKVLRTTKDPREVALLARQLELQEPGKYREAITEAAKAALQKANDDGLRSRDVKQLVKILQDADAK
jgi:hypothetical protein